MSDPKSGEQKHTAAPEKKSGRTMNTILLVVAVLLILFTLKMIHVFETTGAVPDTLITCVFAALGGECGIMGWIKTTKDKYKDREWLVEDRESEKPSADVPRPDDGPQG